jgi:riboflavin synthase
MFTGIVQAFVPVVSSTVESGVLRLGIKLGNLTGGLQIGASVAVNGVCLTVTGFSPDLAYFDVIEETRRLTNIGRVSAGHLVNVERSFHAGDEIGGHVVSGHVSGTVEVVEITQAEGVRNITFIAEPRLMKYLLHKGFVALDGASLTIAFVDYATNRFGICLIPETIERTTLGRVVVGDRVNVEPDSQTQTIVDTVERLFRNEDLLIRLRGNS